MRQNKNKNITKITSGALVLLLASGGLAFNSQASGEAPIAEGNDIKVDDKITESDKVNDLNNALDNLDNLNKTSHEKENAEIEKNNLNNLKANYNQKLATVKQYTLEGAGFNEQFVNRAKDAVNKYSSINTSSEDALKKAIDELQVIISEQGSNLISIEDTDEKVFDEEKNENTTDRPSEEVNNNTGTNTDNTNTDNKGDEDKNPSQPAVPSIPKEDKTTSTEDTNKGEQSEDKKNENTTSENKNDKDSKGLTENKDNEEKKLPYANREEFVNYIASFSDKAKAKNIFPSVMIGQAIHESDYGRSKLATEDFNIFGVKATNKSQGNEYKTQEYIDGKLVNTKDKFRQYNSFEEAIDYYLNLLNRGGYAKNKVADAKTAKEQLQRIKAAGYATDPIYVSKVLNIINAEKLSRFDGEFKENLVDKTNKNNERPEKSQETKKNDKNNSTSKPETDKKNKEDKNNKPADETTNETSKTDKSLENKNKLAGEINKIKILLKDGSWTKESEKEARNILNEVEKALIKENLTSKEYDKLKEQLNSIQINVLKEAKNTTANKNNRAKQAPKKVVENVINNDINTEAKKQSTNVKTGVGSLSSILLTLTAAGSALFASRKRK